MPKNFENLAIFPGSELELVRQFMASEGVEESNWLFGSGLDYKNSVSPGNAISLKQFDVIYRNVYRLANRPGLGIDFGISLNLSRWGMLSAALLCANSLGHALAIADEFKEILRSRFVISNEQNSNMHLLNLRQNPDMQFPINETFAYEIFLGSLKTQISQLLGKPFYFSTVKLPYPKPKHEKWYQKITDKPVQFESRSAQVSISLGLLRIPLPMTNRFTRQEVVSRCRTELDRIKSARSGDIAFTIRGILAQSDGDLPSLSELASKLSMSPRTLRRRLQDENVQFRQLCEQERQQRAISLLSSEELSLKQISKLCGFKDNASFHKAFKRWTNETPARYKRRLRTLE